MTDIIIIGGGMAGLTAALYCLRAGRTVTVIEKETFGGQITSSPRVENYPGLPGVSGNELADALLGQVMDLGAQIEMEDVTGFSRTENGFTVLCGDKKEFSARALILAAGARHRLLGLPREEELTGRGISYCALCDGDFYRGLDVAVAGGGNSAAQAALSLSDICRSVSVIQEFDHFTCDERDEAALRARSNITPLLSSRITAFTGEDKLTGLVLCGPEAGQQSELMVSGLFVSVGRIPDTEPFRGLVSCDEAGYIITDDLCGTDMPGVWAAGDCREKTVRQLTTAAADGTIAAVQACRWLSC